MVILIRLIVSDSFEHFVEDFDVFERSTIFIRNDNFVDQIYENFDVFDTTDIFDKFEKSVQLRSAWIIISTSYSPLSRLLAEGSIYISLLSFYNRHHSIIAHTKFHSVLRL